MKQSAQTMGVVRAKNARQKRKLKKEEPKVFENTKVTVLIKGGNVSNTITQVMHDFHRLKVKPKCSVLGFGNLWNHKIL